MTLIKIWISLESLDKRYCTEIKLKPLKNDENSPNKTSIEKEHLVQVWRNMFLRGTRDL